MMKGILLAGGSGTRLHPVTHSVNKQLLPVYDKPMIYYAFSTLMLAGINEILIITTLTDGPLFESLFGDGQWLGMKISYAVQENPNGIPEAFIIGRDFINGDSCALILGDNIFFGHGFPELLTGAASRNDGATIFAYKVSNPERYGIIEWGGADQVKSLVEKPADPPSSWAITGLYFFDARVCDIAAGLKPSARGETEIVDVLQAYLDLGALTVEKMGRGYAWLDTGTHESLIQAGQYISTIEQRQGLKIACVEEIAWRKGLIDVDDLRRLANSYPDSSYGRYLRNLETE